MNADEFFKQVEELKDKNIPGHFAVTFTYTTGETETFEYHYDPRWYIFHSMEERKQYYLHKNTLINMNHVVKIQFEDLDKK